MKNNVMADAFSALKEGRHADAEALLTQLVRENPGNFDAWTGLGMVASAAGHRKKAAEHMMHALKVKPDWPPALQWLTLDSMAANRIGDALGYGARYLELIPNNPQVFDAVGRAYLANNQPEEALECFNRAIALLPDRADLHFGRGSALRELGQNAEAILALEKAIQLHPAVAGFMRLADAQVAVGRLGEAIVSGKSALALNDSLPAVHILLARLFEDAGRGDEANRHWQLALELEPNKARIHLERAETRITLADFAGAAEDLHAAIGYDPHSGIARRMLTQLEGGSESTRPDLTGMERLSTDASLPVTDRMELFYALGKALESAGDFGKAMQAYDSANKLKLEHVLHGQTLDRSAMRKEIDTLISLFKPELFEQVRGGVPASETPILVVGMMRSGTTLVEQILTCHPDIGGAGEQMFWLAHEREPFETNPLGVRMPRALELAKEYVDLLERLQPGFTRVVDKNPGNVLMAGLVHLVLPNARIIQIRRNAADTAISVWTTPMRTKAPYVCDRESIVFAHKEFIRLMDHWRSVLPPDRFMEVSYEALTSEPEVHTRAMVDFSGLPWNDACLHPSNNVRRVTTPSFWQVRQPVYQSSKERWRRYEPWLGPFLELVDLA